MTTYLTLAFRELSLCPSAAFQRMIRVWNQLLNIFLALETESGQKSVKVFVTLELPV